MLSTRKKQTQIEHRWREWVETTVPKAFELTEDFRDHGWIDIGFQDGWEGVKAVLQTEGAVPSAGVLQDLRRETEDAIAELKPLYERTDTLDGLIDHIVYRLYGLAEEEINIVEQSLKGAQESV
jgi:hypothetical protein